MSDMMRLVATLERELQGLILEWERFFSGDRRMHPHMERTRLESRIRQLQETALGRPKKRLKLSPIARVQTPDHLLVVVQSIGPPRRFRCPDRARGRWRSRLP